MLNSEAKAEVVIKHGKNDKDTGSSEVQVGILTRRITELQDHFKLHKKDHHSRHGLLKLVSQRRRLLDYLARTKPDSYRALIAELGLRR